MKPSPIKTHLCLLLASFLYCTSTVAAEKSPPLAAYGAELKQTSVSGLSSGAFMTSQLYVAFSDIMVGAGIIAGGPYLCAKSWPLNTLLVNATTTCMNPLIASVAPNTPRLVKLTQQAAKSGEIDPIDNFKDDRLYLFSGTNDKTVTTLVVDAARMFFEKIGVPADAILYNKSVDAGHAFITDNDNDSKCSTTQPPYINDCDFEQANAILKHIYPDMQAPAQQLSSQVQAFDQTEFIDSKTTSMSDTAYVYVPEACKTGKSCRIHVVLHGCKQGAEVIGDKYYTQTGYNQMAESNNLIMLYPQVAPSSVSPFNPRGCWDFWGYSSPMDFTPDFYSKEAPQLSAIYKMIARIAEPKP